MNKYDDYLWSVRSWLWSRYGVNQGNRIMEPLQWYYTTGRASAAFLMSLIKVRRDYIGRILAKNYSTYDAAINAVKERIER